jgi:hypothetical protein
MNADKNEIEIIEGDMVKLPDGKLGKVKFPGAFPGTHFVEYLEDGQGRYFHNDDISVIEEPTFSQEETLRGAGVDWDPVRSADGPRL